MQRATKITSPEVVQKQLLYQKPPKNPTPAQQKDLVQVTTNGIISTFALPSDSSSSHASIRTCTGLPALCRSAVIHRLRDEAPTYIAGSQATLDDGRGRRQGHHDGCQDRQPRDAPNSHRVKRDESKQSTGGVACNLFWP